ncbi:DUF4136 domain-containing protein [Gilvimarinus xylanilyticus]|uniref:DUF4136 domain-containing protein n=1 Tax=Gilvimarinus xylanilyticus TaxID=2944139 RepID=A0A9X2I1H8_9GAMM|nr:DUF4136 domain-containing protein [Gilvimarinus xylanilyticus]MCP8897832.1 DUF4136 domain-containing protein [Gilvimarinus xylanilyticus]
MFSQLRISTVIIAVACALLLACQSNPRPQISHHQDKQADFSQYQSFSLADEPEIQFFSEASGKHYKSAFDQSIIAAMEAKGYQYQQSDGDLYVNYRAEVDNELDSFNNAIPITPTRMGYYQSWASWYSGPLTQETEGGNTRISYTGAINIDVVDWSEKRAVWQGVYQKKLVEKNAQEAEKMIDQAVTKVLSSLPKR